MTAYEHLQRAWSTRRLSSDFFGPAVYLIWTTCRRTRDAALTGIGFAQFCNALDGELWLGYAFTSCLGHFIYASEIGLFVRYVTTIFGTLVDGFDTGFSFMEEIG